MFMLESVIAMHETGARRTTASPSWSSERGRIKRQTEGQAKPCDGNRRLLRAHRERPRRRAAEQRDERAPIVHVWMAPALQEIIWRAAQRSLAVMCPACSRSPEGLLALMESANRGMV